MAKILKRERLVPNIHLIEVEAPEIAMKSKPGQFVIVMPDERGERIPLTIADWDRKTPDTWVKDVRSFSQPNATIPILK